MPKITYIGTKEKRADTVAGTGLIWTPGQSHDVPNVAQANALLQYSNVWALDEDQKGATPAQNSSPEATKQPDNTPPPVLPNLEGMDKQALKAFAQEKYGENLHHAMSEANMRAKVLTLIQARGPK